MSSVWTHTFDKTPKIDCGLCGYVRCACFARAAMVADCESDSCPVLSLPEFLNQKKEFNLLVRHGAQGFPKRAPEMPKGGVLLTSPCRDRVDRVMAELRVHNGVKEGDLVRFPVFDSLILCDMLECLSSHFEVVKCSRDLGYARADTGETSITVLQDGRINMRRMNDLSHVKRLFAMIETAIMPSVVCNCCGRDLLSILAEGSEDAKHEHTVFKAGNSLGLNAGQLSVIPSRKTIQSYAGEPSRDALRTLDSSFDWLKAGIDRILMKTPSKANTRPDPGNTRSLLVGLANDNRMRGRESVIFKAQAIGWVIDNGIRGLSNVEQELKHASGAELRDFQEILSLAANGRMPVFKQDEAKSRISVGYAHMRRIDRAMKAFNRWASTQQSQ